MDTLLFSLLLYVLLTIPVFVVLMLVAGLNRSASCAGPPRWWR
ncbi:hypothetical protein V2I01_17205 [Micromonospora sp. BRA006-A]|nr:hypothetical protein [Micromonospora sp. BRA006-A]